MMMKKEEEEEGEKGIMMTTITHEGDGGAGDPDVAWEKLIISETREEQPNLFTNGVLDKECIGGNAKDDVASAGIGVEEAHILLQHRLQVHLSQPARLPLPRVHPTSYLCK